MPNGLDIDNSLKNLKTQLEQIGITSKQQQTSLKIYLSRIEEHLLAVSQIQASVLDQVQMLDPKFDASIVEVQKNYNNIIKEILESNLKAAKNVQNIAGVFGFVVGCLETTITGLQQISKIEQQVLINLTSREDKAPFIQKEALEHHYKVIEEHETAIDNLFLLEQKKIPAPIPSTEFEAIRSLSNLISEAHSQSQIFITNVKNTINESINKINERIKKISLNDNKIPRELMSSHLMRGTSSASVYHGVNFFIGWLTRIYHYARKIHARAIYSKDLLDLLSTDSALKPTSLEIKCLTSIPKRYSKADFDANNRGYYEMMKELQMALFLIRKAEPRDLYENANLLKSLIMCEVDKKAIETPFLKVRLLKQNSFFSSSPDFHLDIKKVLIKLWGFSTQARDVPSKEKYLINIQDRSLDIINFYVEHLIEGFLTHPVFRPWVEKKTDADQKKLLELIVTIINNELSDESPSDYYRAPLCGLSLFCGALGEKDSIKLELNDNTLTLNFSGGLGLSGETIKRPLSYTTMLNLMSPPVI